MAGFPLPQGGTIPGRLAPPSSPADEAAAATVQANAAPDNAAPAPATLTPEQESKQLKELAGSYGVTFDTMDPSQLILQGWAQGGIDITDPNVVKAAHNPVVQAAFKSGHPDVNFFQFQAGLLQQYPSVQGSNYQNALAMFGGQAPTFAPTPTPTPGEAAGQKPGFGAKEEFTTNRQSGAVYYRNGVIWDPTSNAIAFPPGDVSIQGSPGWINNARTKWTDSQILALKQKLAQFGYLTKAQAKSPVWDTSTDAAVTDYYTSKYQHFGHPLVKDSAAGGAGASGFQNARAVQNTIKQNVLSQYQSVFGADAAPKPDELQSWVNFVINQANELQKSKSLAPGAAVGEAESMYSGRLTQAKQQSAENTSLNDSLTTAIQATNGLA
jgi:hypothetical protein